MGSKKDLKDQLEGLFFEDVSKPETEAKKAEETEPSPAEDILADLLKSEATDPSTGAEIVTAESDIAAFLAGETAGIKPTAKPAKVKPVEVKPAAAKPVEVKPAAAKPVEAKPAAAKPAKAKPVEAKPAKTKPAKAKPVEAKPAKAKPVEVKPAVTEPVEAKPAAKPVEAKPVEVKPAVAEPVEAKPAAAEPVKAKPIVAKPVVTLPPVTEPAIVEAPSAEAIPPDAPAWDTVIKERRSRIVSIMLGSLAGIATVVIAILLMDLGKDPSTWWPVAPYFIAYIVLVALAFSWRLNTTVRVFCLAALAYVAGTNALYREGAGSAGGLYLIAGPLLLSLLVKQWAGAVAAGVSSVLYAGFVMAEYYGLTVTSGPPGDTNTMLMLSGTFPLIIAGVMFAQWALNSFLATALQETTHSHTLIKKRTDELSTMNVVLEKRTRQLQAAAQISQAAATVLDPDDMMQQAVISIQHQLVLYHVSLFLIDETGAVAGAQRAVLKASTGDVGRRMLAQGHWVYVGSSSAVGQCTASGQTNITLDVSEEAARFDDLLLPKTRSNVALPLQARGRVIGALNVQSTMPGAFSEEDLAALRTIADYLAVAIDNALAFAETRARLKELEAIQQMYVREEWSKFTRSREIPLYERARPDVPPLSEPGRATKQAIAQQKVVAQSEGGNGAEQAALVAPLRLRGEVIGALGLHEMEHERQWTDDEVALVEAVATQMALAIENARLLEETQLRAGRLTLVNRITGTAGAASNLEDLMEAVGQEVVPAFEAEAFFIALYDEEADEIDYRYLIDKGIRQPPARYSMSVGVTPIVINEKKTLVIHNSDEYKRLQPSVTTFGETWLAESWLGVPLIVGDRVTGVINVQSLRPNTWDEEDVLLLSTIADQVAVAIDNVRLIEETQQRAARLTVVNRIAGTAGAAGSTDDLMKAVYEEIAPVFQPDAFFIALYDEEAQELDFRIDIDEGKTFPPHQDPLGVGLTSVVVTERRPLFIRDLEQEPEYQPLIAPMGTGKPPVSWLGVPLTIGERVIGVINVQSYHPSAWDEEDELLLLTIADQVAVAIENVRLFEETRIHAEELAVLNELAQALTAQLDVDQVLDEAYRGTSRLVDTTNFHIGLYDAKKNVIVFSTSEDATGEFLLPAEKGVSGYILRTRQPVLIAEKYAEWTAERGIDSVGHEALSWVGAPLLVGNQPLGVMFTQNFETTHAFNEHDRDLLSSIANQVAIALQNARLFEDANTRAKELATLNELAQALTASTSLDEVFEEAYQGASRLLRTKSFYVGLYDPIKSEIYFPFDTSESEEDRQITTIPADQGLTGYVLQNRKSVLIGKNMEEQLEEMGIESIGGDTNSWLGVPIMLGDQALGVMVVQSYTIARAFDERDRDLLMAVASQTAIAIQSTRLFEQVQRQAEQERQIYEITTKLRRSPDIATILQTAVDELGRVLQVDRALVRLTTRPQEERASTGRETVEKART
jgi:GAF domain-containing protein